MLMLGKKGQDIIGCAITSNPQSEGVFITEFEEGNLPFPSKVKYWQINTIVSEVVTKKIAKLSLKNYQEVLDKIKGLMEE